MSRGGWQNSRRRAVPVAHADVLIATDLRDDLDATKHRRGFIDKRGRTIEGIRGDTVNPESGVLRLERLQ